MAVVPYRVSGAAASQQLQEQLLQVGHYSLLLQQRPRDSGNTAHLQHTATDRQQDPQSPSTRSQAGGPCSNPSATSPSPQPQPPDLSRVGFVLWQSGFILADFLLLRLPQLQAGRGGCSSSGWAGVRVLELGCGAGTVGMFLALAGAQVVLTDQPHILPLTSENLKLNFPATRTTAGSNRAPGNAADQAGRGSFGQRGLTASAEAEAADVVASIAATQPEQAAASFHEGKQLRPAAAAGSVNAAFAAAFRSEAAPANAAATAAEQQQQQQLLQFAAAQQTWQVFAAGPLVVEYTWGEPAQQLQQRVAAAAVARHQTTAAAGGSDSTLQDLAPAPCCYDVVVGADLLYEPAGHQPLLDSLQQLCAPHTQVFMCYRCRGLGEGAFEEAAAAGWVVEVLPCHLLHPEFQGGDYRLIRMVKVA